MVDAEDWSFPYDPLDDLAASAGVQLTKPADVRPRRSRMAGAAAAQKHAALNVAETTAVAAGGAKQSASTTQRQLGNFSGQEAAEPVRSSHILLQV